MGWLKDTFNKVSDFAKDTVLPAAGSYFGAGVGQQAANYVLGTDKSAEKNASRDRKWALQDMKIAHDNTMAQVKLGNQMDMSNQKEMFDYRINSGLEHGMTPYEMFMGPAAGAGGGTSGSGNTLGNQYSQQAGAVRQQHMQNQIMSRENALNRQNDLTKEIVKAQTSKDVAQIQAGVTERGQDIQQQIATDQLELSRTEVHAKLTRIATQNAVDVKQIEKLVNDIATSHPDFVTQMKQLDMGVENMLVEYYSRHHGINLYDKASFMSLPKSKREALIAEMLALTSNTYREGRGAGALGSDAVDAGFDLSDLFGGDSHEPIEMTKGAKRAIMGNKGSGPRFSEPYQAGPNMNYR